MRQKEVTPFDEVKLRESIDHAIMFATILTPSCTIELSSDPQGGFNRLAIPFMLCPPTMTKGGAIDEGPDVDRFILAFQEIVFAIAQHIEPELIEEVILQAHEHKKEIHEDDSVKP